MPPIIYVISIFQQIYLENCMTLREEPLNSSENFAHFSLTLPDLRAFIQVFIFALHQLMTPLSEAARHPNLANFPYVQTDLYGPFLLLREKEAFFHSETAAHER